jgi:hypothetical protein
MADAIKLLKKDEVPSLLDTEKANELIRQINAFVVAKVSPDGSGKFVVSRDQAVLDLGPIANQLTAILQTQRAIMNALQNPNFSIVCNGGNITATLTFPV